MVTRLAFVALSIAVFGFAAGCASTAKSNNNNSTSSDELDESASVHFSSTGSWDPRWEGSLLAGGSLAIDYDFARLPQCRNEGRVVSWVIEVTYRFDGGETTTAALAGSPGTADTLPDSGIRIPEGAHAIEMWFQNRAVGGYDNCSAWDSAYGANYTHSID